MCSCSMSPVRDVTGAAPSGPAVSEVAASDEALRREEPSKAVGAHERVVEPVADPSPSLAPTASEAVTVETTPPIGNIDLAGSSSSSAVQPGLSLLTAALREGVTVCGDVEVAPRGLAVVRIDILLSILRADLIVCRMC